jgi:hypothetical protein
MQHDDTTQEEDETHSDASGKEEKAMWHALFELDMGLQVR